MSAVKIPAKDIKAVAKSLSATLKENPVTVEIEGEEVELSNIKVVGVKRSTVLEMIQESIQTLAEDEVELDESVVDFFNTYIADDEGEEEAEEGEEEAEEGEEEEAPKKKAAGKKKAPAKKDGEKKTAAAAVERDNHGFSVNSKYHTFAEMISENPMKMADIRKELNDNYYNIVKAKPEIFAKNALGFFYVIGSAAEKLANSMKAPEKKAADKKKAPAKKAAGTKKAPAKKAAGTKKAPAKKAAAKKTTKRRPAKK